MFLTKQRQGQTGAEKITSEKLLLSHHWHLQSLFVLSNSVQGFLRCQVAELPLLPCSIQYKTSCYFSTPSSEAHESFNRPLQHSVTKAPRALPIAASSINLHLLNYIYAPGGL